MSAQEFLEQYQEALREEGRIGRLIRRQRDRLTIHGIDTSREKIKTSGLNDQQAKLVAELVDFERDLEAKRKESVQVMQEVVAAIEAVEDRRLQEILWLRYVDGLRWSLVVERTGYSWSHLFRLHQRGILVVDELLNSTK